MAQSVPVWRKLLVCTYWFNQYTVIKRAHLVILVIGAAVVSEYGSLVGDFWVLVLNYLVVALAGGVWQLYLDSTSNGLDSWNRKFEFARDYCKVTVWLSGVKNDC